MKEGIKKAIKESLREMKIEEIDFTIEHPADMSYGDYATNVAMMLARQMQKNPREVAKTIKEKLEGVIKEVEKIEIAGPGFLNFHLKRSFYANKLNNIAQDQKEWGRNESWKGKKVLVEYTDPNPFKEFHIGHLFTNAVGESIARLFMFSGAETKRVNYQGDVGMHVACAIFGIKKMEITANKDFSARDLGKAYAIGATAFKESEGDKKTITAINKKVYEKSDEEINSLYDKGREVSLAYFEKIYQMLGTQFDAYFFESDAAPRGKEIVLSHPEVFQDSDGAKVFDGEKYGLHTRVFLNSEGLPTYEAKELALAKMKEEKFDGYDHSIVSTSNEINEYFKVLKKAMSFVYPELEKKTEHIGHGNVRLSDGKMSSRTGKIIATVDFVDEIKEAAKEKIKESKEVQVSDELAKDVAIAAIKYATLQGNIVQDSVFDKEKALSFTGNSGPYLQYTHARICSVLKKAQELEIKPSTQNAPKNPYELEKIIYQFPEVVKTALSERAPHKVTTFLTELASAFNTFYAKEKIADKSDQQAPYKIALAQAVAQTIKNGLWVLGISAPEKM
ncbi:MAG: arginine--tRNA ligase [Candidatus Moranbacteria bacterium]|nr:arginine--tRNA ligase [Candidatus Moranbacteria bacterium]